MIIVEHGNHDAKKSAYFWQNITPRLSALAVDYTNGHKYYAVRSSYSMIITDFLECIHQLLFLPVPVLLTGYKRLAYKYAVINFVPLSHAGKVFCLQAIRPKNE